MKLAQIYLPDRANHNGGSMFMEHRQLQAELLKRWGGWTRTTGTGSWLHEGREIKEPVSVYSIAMSPADAPTLRVLAARTARAAKQQCVMIVTPNGDVDFVKPALDDTQTVS